MSKNTTYRDIGGASGYAIGPDDIIINKKTGQQIKKHWRGNHFRSRILDDEGVLRWVNHNLCNVATTTELPDQEMVVVEGYPDYKVTPSGAVWKYRKLARKRRNSPFIVATRYVSGSDYVRLVTEDGRVHMVNVEKIVRKAYPND